MEKVAELAKHLAELNKWIEDCPFQTDGVYECAAVEMNEIERELQALAAETGDEALIETVNGAVDEGEYGEHFDDNRPGFWEEVARMATK